MSFLKKIIGGSKPGESIDPLDAQLKQKIEHLVISKLDNYQKNYMDLFTTVTNERSSKNLSFVFAEVDREAHSRAGIKSLKETASRETWEETEDDVERNVKTKTSNDLAMKAAKMAGKKGVEMMVERLIDEGIKRITTKKKDEKA